METQTHIYRISYREWISGIRLARRRDPIWMGRFLFGWLIPVLFAYLIGAGIWGVFTGVAKKSDVANATLVLGILLILFVGYRIFRLRRLYSKSIVARHEAGLALAFNEEYFVLGFPGHSEARFLWPALYDFAENKLVALIYTSKKHFIVIPRHAMPDRSWSTLRELIPQRKARS